MIFGSSRNEKILRCADAGRPPCNGNTFAAAVPLVRHRQILSISAAPGAKTNVLVVGSRSWTALATSATNEQSRALGTSGASFVSSSSSLGGKGGGAVKEKAMPSVREMSWAKCSSTGNALPGTVNVAESGKYEPKRSASRVADMTITLNDSTTTRSLRRTKRKSVRASRSWASSTTTCVTEFRRYRGSCWSRCRRTPTVTNSSLSPRRLSSRTA
mmetsp:Transcript_13235/g.43142  ORF Transcript_13235/g.43142 Transcript_13235/m.43142 type:complete len:215 (-) Transcript_13235:102-746(-)